MRYAVILLAACVSAPSIGQRADAIETPSARVWIQAALDAEAAGGTVTIPAGRWVLDRAPAGSYNRFAALSTHGHDITIRGVGPESVLVLEGDQGGQSVAVLSVDPGATHIRVTDLTFDLSGATNTDEQTHAIATSGVCSGTTCRPIVDVSIDHVTFRHPRNTTTRKGDCIRLLGGTTETRLSSVRIENNNFEACARSAVMIQRNVSDVVISGNTLSAVKTCIDGEATGTGLDERLTISDNVFAPGCAPALSLTNTHVASVTGNAMASGITVYRSTGVTITGNAISQVATGDTGTIDVANVCDGLVIQGNTIERSGAMGPVIKLAPHSGGICSNVTIGPNHLDQLTAAWGIYLESVSGASIIGNQMRFVGAPAYSAIYERSVVTGAPVTGVLVSGNQVAGPVTYGVQMHAAPGTFGAGISVSGNTAPGTIFGLYLNNPGGFSAPVTCSGNTMGPGNYPAAAVNHGD